MSIKEIAQGYWDRPLNGIDQTNRIPRFFGQLVYVLVGLLYKICFRYKVVGRENIRGFESDKRGFVVFANHASYADVIFGYLAPRPKQWARFVGRDTLFDNAGYLLGWILSVVGAFPVSRDSADVSVVKRAAKYLKNGEMVQIFPEGTRRGKTTTPPDLHAGGALMARMGKAAVVPCSLKNTNLIKPKGKRMHFPRVTIQYGLPVQVSDFDFLPRKERLDGLTWFVMREVYAMRDGIDPEAVDMKGLFPHNKDFSEEFAGFVPPSRKQANA